MSRTIITLLLLLPLTPALFSQNQTNLELPQIMDSLVAAQQTFSTNPVKAAQTAQQVLEYGISQQNDSITYRASLILGYCNYFMGNYQSSNQHYQRILAIGNKLEIDSAAIYNNMGVNHEFLGAFDQAIQTYLQSVAIEETRGNLNGKFMSWVNIGMVAIKNNDFPTALNYLNEAQSYFANVQDTAMLALCYQNKGIAFIKSEVRDSGQYYVDLALEWNKKMNSLPGQFETLYNAGKNYILYRADYNRALDAIQQAEDLLTLLSEGLRMRYLPYLNYLKGDYYFAVANYPQARYWYQQIQDYWQMQGGKEYADLLYNLAVIYGQADDFDQMKATLKDWSTLNDSLYQEKTSAQMASARANYEVNLLQQQITINQLEKRQIQLRSRLLWVAFVMAVGAAGYVYYRLKQQKQLNKTLFHLNQHDIESPVPVQKGRYFELYQQMKQLMETKQLYLDPLLNREEIARKLNTNPGYISEAIKYGNHSSFSYFINTYRIRQAKLALLHNPDSAQEDIYPGAGFNSKATYYRVFKQHTGLSPAAFVEQLKQNEAAAPS